MNSFIDCLTQLRSIKMNRFTTSIDFCTHPLLNTKKKTRFLYFTALEYLTASFILDDEFVNARLSQYKTLLVGDDASMLLTLEICDNTIKLIVNDFFKPWGHEYRLMLLCDIALILLDDTAVKKAYGMMSKFVIGQEQEKINELFELLYSEKTISPVFVSAENLIAQFRINQEFTSQQVMRVMVTANMSAGKSTLINALIGKPITRTSQEACTADLCYLYSKPFEDNRIHLAASQLNLNATYNDLLSVGRESVSGVASYFRASGPPQRRICLIDTPGVNSALNSSHGKLTRKAIVEENYDKLIYVLNASLLGTDDEIKHLKYVYENVPNEKIVFVLNKLDCFKSIDDSISSSIDDVKADLVKIGFKNPVICPISAYFSLLLKMKQNNEELSEDEQDIFNLYVKKFSKSEYDLSIYYHNELTDKKLISDELIKMSFISGLFGLENILYRRGRHMKKVFIKYNPYKLETEIMVDGKKLKENSLIGARSADGFRLQDWVEELPHMLVDEYNDTDFEIEFHGTVLDYEDIISVFTEANNLGEIKAEIKECIRAKETSDKETLIEDVFNEIQKGPFDELRHEEIISAFQHAKSSDFEVCVVATMSAGKSTLINAMIGSKLMPSKMEACTAIITRIKDNDSIPFQAEVYNKENHLTESYNSLSLPIMERLNSDDNVSEIKIAGNIPFVSSDDVSLVLIDTPGPNNSRDPHHKEVQSKLLGKSSKALVLYIMTGEFGTDDDNALLERVAKSMAVDGKQSKDRFIFVVNKLDDRKTEDGDTSQTLARVRTYLKTHGVANPNLFPAAALPALNLRMIMSGADVDDDTIDETEVKVKKLNRNKALHFETYAPLPASVRGEIKGRLDEARSTHNGPDIENQHEALIHTGIISIEAAIRQYVQKYAKTAKIKNIVDTFMHKLDELDCFEETKRELVKNCEESARIVAQIASIREKMDSVKEAKKFKDAVDDAVVKVNHYSREAVEGVLEKFQILITKRISDFSGNEIDVDDVEDEIVRLEKFAKKLEPDFKEVLDEIIRTVLVNASNVLLESYQKKLASLAEEVNVENLVGVKIDPLKLMSGSVIPSNFSTKDLIEEKEVENGKEYVTNTDKKWYKPWTWLKEEGYYRTQYKKVKYVPGDELAQKFLEPIQKCFYNNGDSAIKYAMQQSEQIADHFNGEFKHLDDVLKAKLGELESYATEKEKADERINETERRLEWLDGIKAKVESILEI